MSEGFLFPDWPSPPQVRAAVVTRAAPGVSPLPFGRCNLGLHSGDDPARVERNRAGVAAALALPSAPCWLRQVHGCAVFDADAVADVTEPVSDAAISRQPGTVLAILTADCLPVLLASRDGGVVAAAHSGWRGLAGGVLEATLAAMARPAAAIVAWLGPCIGACSYEVGAEVRQAFVDADAAAEAAFAATRPGHWQADLAWLARRRLQRAGVLSIHGGGFDTFTDPRFHSYRRDGARSGRFASLIWIDPAV
ncbi:MAG TPA: peptidoglycan editing factor PgeF [Rhodanobacteraceae bacterium]|nr:peptidoglycan editing factor PgeF [Rhodanobacteraceae bacterium]